MGEKRIRVKVGTEPQLSDLLIFVISGYRQHLLQLKLEQFAPARIEAFEIFSTFRVICEVAEGDDVHRDVLVVGVLDSCFYKEPASTLQEAEEEALRQTVEHADLANGQSIL